MNSRYLLKYAPCATITTSSLHTYPSPQLFHASPSTKKPIFLQISLRKRGLCYSAYSPKIPRPVQVEHKEIETLDSARYVILKKKLNDMDINCDSCTIGEYNRMICPQCGGGDSQEKSFSLYITPDRDMAMWNCFRGNCGWRGNVRAFDSGNSTFSKPDEIGKIKRIKVITEESIGLEPLCKELLGYFAERMISAETLRRNGVMQKTHYEVAIAFTYRRDGVLVSCKYRDIEKRFWQEKDTERILYGLDDIKQVNDIIIVEGEMDKLSMEEAGFRNCVSVPDGAPSMVSKETPALEKDTKYQYLWNCKEYFDKTSRIILATDADGPGQALAEELARRLGRERCWRINWPKKTETEVYKDANEVLMYLGPHALREVIDQAELYPIRGLFKFSDFFHEIDEYFHHHLGYEQGASTGWMDLDKLYKIVPGELTIVTGVPNSGKSEWIDALLCNINEREGWKFALCSMENKVREHARKLLEKHIRKPFFTAGYSGTAERMNVEEFERGKEWLNETFHLIRCEDDCLPSITWVLDLAKAAVFRHGVRGLVIDPYNELDHQRPPNQTETEYVSQMLTKIKRFAQHHSCHVWFVAHPRQLHQWVGGPPNLYDISGSAHFINKCDNGIVVHRNRNPEAGPVDQVQICVRKVRNKVAGCIGDALLSYNRITGEFQDIDEPAKRQSAIVAQKLANKMKKLGK
ncbi:twinkle-like protein [Thalictrum thalictroides]|uniref:Twinkle-like protein n=1 Tax=Thalictrum thalictroides TaxID=46969 RepID=A0A7J6W727_THATH|nr:twinkle-like protein [Thalictrum thalictroides]